MKRSLSLAVPAAGFAVLATASAGAQVPLTLTTPGSQCIRLLDSTVKSLPLQGTGFAPNAAVTIAADGAPIDTAQADAAGAFAQMVSPPALGANVNKKDAVSITADDGQGHAAAPLTLPEARLTVDWPDTARGNPRVLFRAYGFPMPGRNVYLHIRRLGRTKGTFKLGKADAPCGLASRRMRYMPLAHHSAGNYLYYFDQNKRFDKERGLLRYTVRITRTFRAAAVGAGAATTRSPAG